jgi:hypothetical protein
MAKKNTKEVINKSEKDTKYERIFTSSECVSIWKYDMDITTSGPISVEHKWDSEYLKRIELRQRRGR